VGPLVFDREDRDADAAGVEADGAAQLLGEGHLRGTLTAGRLAELTIWDEEPAEAAGDTLRDLDPTHTITGGGRTHRHGYWIGTSMVD
jgi:predicted amidohydrolase YtcJ